MKVPYVTLELRLPDPYFWYLASMLSGCICVGIYKWEMSCRQSSVRKQVSRGWHQLSELSINSDDGGSPHAQRHFRRIGPVNPAFCILHVTHYRQAIPATCSKWHSIPQSKNCRAATIAFNTTRLEAGLKIHTPLLTLRKSSVTLLL